MNLSDHYKAVRARLNAGAPPKSPEPPPKPPDPPPPPPPKPKPLGPQMAEAHMIIANRLDQGAPVWLTILRDVCEKHNVTRDDLNSRRKTANLLPPRQEAYYRLREAGYSLKRIANLMGGRDHTTVLHGAKVYAERNRVSSATMSGRADQSGSVDHCPAGVNCARLRPAKEGW